MKNYLIAGVVLLVIVAGFLVWSNSQKSSPGPKMTEEKTMVVKDDNATSRYVEYSKAALDQIVDKRRVLYFYANWCPTCRPADANFRQNTTKIPEDVVVIRVNYADSDTDQEEKDLANLYEITYQHTFVQIDTQGKEVITWNGGQIEELLLNLK